MKILSLYRKRLVDGKFDGKKYTQWNHPSYPHELPVGTSPLMIEFVELDEDFSI